MGAGQCTIRCSIRSACGLGDPCRGGMWCGTVAHICMSVGKFTAVGALAALMGSCLTAGVAVAAPIAGAPVGASTITLFTGDRVTLSGRDVTVAAAQGRGHTRFLQEVDEHGDVHVVPEDATGMLRAKRLDPRLFNITQLIKNGFGDAHRADVPLIVSGAPRCGLPRFVTCRVSVARRSGWISRPVSAISVRRTKYGWTAR